MVKDILTLLWNWNRIIISLSLNVNLLHFWSNFCAGHFRKVPCRTNVGFGWLLWIKFLIIFAFLKRADILVRIKWSKVQSDRACYVGFKNQIIFILNIPIQVLPKRPSAKPTDVGFWLNFLTFKLKKLKISPLIPASAPLGP